MIFDEQHKVKHRLLTDREEARAFIDFLQKEKTRHLSECVFAEDAIDDCAFFGRGESKYFKALAEFYKSQTIRHREDVEAIDISIKEVKDRLEL